MGQGSRRRIADEIVQRVSPDGWDWSAWGSVGGLTESGDSNQLALATCAWQARLAAFRPTEPSAKRPRAVPPTEAKCAPMVRPDKVCRVIEYVTSSADALISKQRIGLGNHLSESAMLELSANPLLDAVMVPAPVQDSDRAEPDSTAR